MSMTPGVNINTVITTRLLQDINNGSAFIIATADWGAENSFIEYEGASEITDNFKSGALVTAANLFVEGGGREIKVYRFSPTDANKSTKNFVSGATDVLQIDAKYEGTYGNNIWVVIEDVNGARKLTISDDRIREIYDNDGVGYSTNADIVSAINASSVLVTATQLVATLVDTVSKTFLVGGDNGTTIALSNITSIINTYMDKEYDFLLVPEITADVNQASIAVLMNNRAATYKEFSIYVTGISLNEAYSATISRTATTIDGRMILLAPGTYVYDATNYSGAYGACYYAGLLAKQQLGVSLTHATFALEKFVNASTSLKHYTPSQVENLIEAGFTVINKIGNYIGVIRAVTKINDNTSPLFEQVVMKEIDYLKINLYNLLNPFVGQPNTSQKRLEIQAVVDSSMNNAKQNNIITDYQSEVLLDGVDKVKVNLNVTPTYPINTITVNLII